ncbi:MAG: FAD-binding oxidoreductase [Chloroflexi bacterium]|nr:FAD-binding oxidoreductase [Chloroflexota bacterium]
MTAATDGLLIPGPPAVKTVALPTDRLERVEGWGRAVAGLSYLYRPTMVEGLQEVFQRAREAGCSVGLRGAGRSYGDAALNAENILLDLSRMRRILAWDPGRGVITVEPGVTIQQLWEYTIEDGWWPPVVPGTMFPTLGGCAGMNIHGKNNFRAGTLGEHILEFEALLPTGELLTCTPEQHPDLFHAIIGGFGMLGCFTRLTLQLKRV